MGIEAWGGGRPDTGPQEADGPTTPPGGNRTIIIAYRIPPSKKGSSRCLPILLCLARFAGSY